jgi:hypothetical protein
MKKTSKKERYFILAFATICLVIGLPLMGLTILMLSTYFKNPLESSRILFAALLPLSFSLFFLSVAAKLFAKDSHNKNLFSYRALLLAGIFFIFTGLSIIIYSFISDSPLKSINAASGAISFGAMIIATALTIKKTKKVE